MTHRVSAEEEPGTEEILRRVRHLLTSRASDAEFDWFRDRAEAVIRHTAGDARPKFDAALDELRRSPDYNVANYRRLTASLAMGRQGGSHEERDAGRQDAIDACVARSAYESLGERVRRDLVWSLDHAAKSRRLSDATRWAQESAREELRPLVESVPGESKVLERFGVPPASWSRRSRASRPQSTRSSSSRLRSRMNWSS